MREIIRIYNRKRSIDYLVYKVSGISSAFKFNIYILKFLVFVTRNYFGVFSGAGRSNVCSVLMLIVLTNKSMLF